MPPEERRAAIVAATIPLLAVTGTNVTTKQIADAAGVAEGTIFRVFVDKEAVIDAAVAAALDTAPTERALAAIARDIPFDARLEVAVQILQNRITEIWQLLSMLGRTAPAGQRTRQQDLAAPQGEGIGRAQARLQGIALGVRDRTHIQGKLHASA